MSRAIRAVLCSLLSIAFSLVPIGHALGQVSSTNLCQTRGVALVFFNGVQTTPDQADSALAELRSIHGVTSPTGDPIRYEKLYNYSNGFEDFVETFEQRLLEQGGLLEGRFELFFEALNGDGPWWSRIVGTVASTANILSGFADWYKAVAIQRLTALFNSPPTAVNYLEHRARIETLIFEGKKLLLVAHSQGNLFVNPAFDYARTKVSASSVKVVHIAPASPRLTGSHTLADLDLVINGLRVAGTVASVTDLIPGYLLRPAGANGKKDPLGHGLLEIYLNQTLEISTRVKSHIIDGLSTLVAPAAAATSGFFSATLTWNGTGDVDLHTFEPNGTQVYYVRSAGSAGFLDVDNTSANGPEHYYATCSSATLLTGAYRFAVANYSRADGRTATLQVASWSDGVLGTKQVVLGAASGNTPGATLFTVNVTRNPVTGSYNVSLLP